MIEGLSRIQRCEEYDIYPESHDEDIDWKMVLNSKTPAIVIYITSIAKVFAILFNTSHDVQFQSPSWLIIICFLRYTGDRFRPLKQSPWTNRCFVSIIFFGVGRGMNRKKTNTIWMIPIWYDMGHHSIPPTSKMTYNIL